MRTAVTAIALAGLCSSAAASGSYGVGTITLTASTITVSAGSSFTIGVIVDDNLPANDSFGGVWAFNILAQPSAGAIGVTHTSDLIADPLDHPNLLADLVTSELAGATASATGVASDVLFPNDAPLNGATVFSFRVHTDPGFRGTIEYESAVGALNTFDALTRLKAGGVGIPSYYEEILFGRVSVNVIPTPHSLIPLALAFPLAARRRR